MQAPREGRAGDEFHRQCGGRIKISLNGVEQRNVVAYNCDEGWLERYTSDQNDRYLVRGHEMVVERLEGLVNAGM